ncbi:ABC transporter permease [Antarctobacter heliothermus]|uniref:Peptide/nickel transport system permease protein n=1 Tax=Antarctobacter heliothermus TaxID=74033 RepID=A0A239LD24_9RHOB|nr:ABC transporter permease [Antarctobacter heliothermus]SNT27862.1 peptide/nickel transport system permease protein [Antarctobacter heliothermus]
MNDRLVQTLVPIGADIFRSLMIAAGIIVFSFFLIRMIPGDIVDVMGIEGTLTYGQQDAMRESLGLDVGWWQQFTAWLGMVAGGDFGASLRYGTPILDLLRVAMAPTLILGASALAIGLTLGIGLPVLACVFQKPLFVGLVQFITLWSIVVPTFSIGILSVIVFAVWLGWIPAIGNIMVPAIILGMDTAGTLAKMLHEDMVDTERAAFVRTARAKGLSRWRIVLRHILPNALTVVVALFGILLAGALTGAITMEVVFGLPGLGTLTLQAIQGRDYPVVQAVVIWLGLTVVIANLISDLVQRALDPRIGR